MSAITVALFPQPAADGKFHPLRARSLPGMVKLLALMAAGKEVNVFSRDNNHKTGYPAAGYQIAAGSFAVTQVNHGIMVTGHDPDMRVYDPGEPSYFDTFQVGRASYRVRKGHSVTFSQEGIVVTYVFVTPFCTDNPV